MEISTGYFVLVTGLSTVLGGVVALGLAKLFGVMPFTKQSKEAVETVAETEERRETEKRPSHMILKELVKKLCDTLSLTEMMADGYLKHAEIIDNPEMKDIYSKDSKTIKSVRDYLRKAENSLDLERVDLYFVRTELKNAYEGLKSLKSDACKKSVEEILEYLAKIQRTI